MNDKIIVGNAELVSLPDLQLEYIRARIDTGAKTSSLHVNNIEYRVKSGKPYVSFVLNQSVYGLKGDLMMEKAVIDTRWIKSSNGNKEKRYVIHTNLLIAEKTWEVELTLSDREDMSYPMLLGREAMEGRILVDPGESFLLGDIN